MGLGRGLSTERAVHAELAALERAVEGVPIFETAVGRGLSTERAVHAELVAQGRAAEGVPIFETAVGRGLGVGQGADE